jgi:hypothetical protein
MSRQKAKALLDREAKLMMKFMQEKILTQLRKRFSCQKNVGWKDRNCDVQGWTDDISSADEISSVKIPHLIREVFQDDVSFPVAK